MGGDTHYGLSVAFERNEKVQIHRNGYLYALPGRKNGTDPQTCADRSLAETEILAAVEGGRVAERICLFHHKGAGRPKQKRDITYIKRGSVPHIYGYPAESLYNGL